MSKFNARLSAARLPLICLTLLLTVVAMGSPAIAACNPGSTWATIINYACCGTGAPKVLKQNWKCNSSGTAVRVGDPVCSTHNNCIET